MEVAVGEHRVELDRLLEVLERHVGPPQLEQDLPKGIAVDRGRWIDVDRLLERRHRRRRLFVVEVAEGAVVGRTRPKLLYLGLLGRLLASASRRRQAEGEQSQPKPVSS